MVMNAKQRNAVERVRRDVARVEKSLDNLEAVFARKYHAPRGGGGIRVTTGKDAAAFGSNPKGSRKSRPKSHGMSSSGGQE